ncbi:MAG: double zinc ribbon domain-containing protein [Lachnospiraceae bacterium]
MTFKKILYNIFDFFTDILLPRRCPICGQIPSGADRICPDCLKKIRIAVEPVCTNCGKPIEKVQDEICYDCGRTRHLFRQGKAYCLHTGVIRDSMYQIKYANKREYMQVFAKEWYDLNCEWISRKQIQMIIPIPLHRKKRRQRGYNQAKVMADELGKYLDIPVEHKLLYRCRQTRPQKDLNDTMRRQNLKNAFQTVSSPIRLKNILLVDDIYTTGSTIDAAVSALLEAGVENVYFAVISIGDGY